MKVQLIVQSGARPAGFLLKLPTVLGRGQDADIKVKHHHISRHHCEIFADGEELVLRDLKSANGTYVNEHLVDDEVSLSSGDVIKIGAITFRIDVVESTPQSDLSLPMHDPSTTFNNREDDTEANPGVVPQEERHGQAALVQYGETEDGSFVKIDLDSSAPELVSGHIDLGDGADDAPGVSRIDLEVGGNPQPPSADDSALRDFLRKLPGP